MKKLIISLCLMGMVVVPTQVKATQNSEVCVAIVDEDGNVLNQEEYLACLEEHGYGVETYEDKYGGTKG